jgi:hypothetical protein
MPTRRGARSEVPLSPDRVRRVVTILLFAFLLFVLPETVRAQTAAPAAGSDPTYLAAM